MERRSWLKSLAVLATTALIPRAPRALAATAAKDPASSTGHPIVLYCDLAIDPAREQEMLDAFHHHFKPVARKHPGYIDLKMLKLRQVIQGGPAPAKAINYRFQLTYASEALRQQWIKSPDHLKYWPMVEQTVSDKGYLVLLTEEV